MEVDLDLANALAGRAPALERGPQKYWRGKKLNHTPRLRGGHRFVALDLERGNPIIG